MPVNLSPVWLIMSSTKAASWAFSATVLSTLLPVTEDCCWMEGFKKSQDLCLNSPFVDNVAGKESWEEGECRQWWEGGGGRLDPPYFFNWHRNLGWLAASKLRQFNFRVQFFRLAFLSWFTSPAWGWNEFSDDHFLPLSQLSIKGRWLPGPRWTQVKTKLRLPPKSWLLFSPQK